MSAEALRITSSKTSSAAGFGASAARASSLAGNVADSAAALNEAILDGSA